MKNLMYFIFTITLFLTIDTNGIAQEGWESYPKITVEELLEDFEIFRSEIEKMHAGLYTYTTKEDMDMAFDQIKSYLNEPMSAPKFYTYLSRMHPFIKNAHTIIQPSARYDAGVAADFTIMPLDVYWSHDSLFVLRNMSDQIALDHGTYIKSINGKSATKVFNYLSHHWTRDGYNKTFPDGITARAFAEFYANHFGLPANFMFEIIDTEGKVQTIKTAALQTTKRNEIRTQKYGEVKNYWDKSMGDAVTLNIDGDVAILAIKHCGNTDIRKFGKTIKKIFRNAFEDIIAANVEHLIIDIRNNPGGNNTASKELISYLTDQSFKIYEHEVLNHNKISKGRWYKESKFLFDIAGALFLRKRDDGFYEANDFSKVYYGDWFPDLVQPKDIQFKGQIYTMGNYASFSAAGYMAGLLQEHTNSIFIGEEIGGNAKELVAGEYFSLTLPNSKNRVWMPVVHSKIVTSAPQNGHGVIPDHYVRANIREKIAGIDVEMEFIRALIENSTLDKSDQDIIAEQ